MLGLLATARRQLDRVAGHDPALGPITESLAAASFAVAELTGQLASYLATLDADGARELEAVQERRATLAGLVRKYGPTLDDVVDFLDTGSARLLEIDNDDDRIAALAASVEAARASVIALGGRLSDVRRDAAQRLGDAVTGELTALAMPDAAVIVTVEDRQEYSATGKDTVSILLKPHPGAEPRPLGEARRVASSRG